MSHVPAEQHAASAYPTLCIPFSGRICLRHKLVCSAHYEGSPYPKCQALLPTPNLELDDEQLQHAASLVYATLHLEIHSLLFSCCEHHEATQQVVMALRIELQWHQKGSLPG